MHSGKFYIMFAERSTKGYKIEQFSRMGLIPPNNNHAALGNSRNSLKPRPLTGLRNGGRTARPGRKQSERKQSACKQCSLTNANNGTRKQQRFKGYDAAGTCKQPRVKKQPSIIKHHWWSGEKRKTVTELQSCWNIKNLTQRRNPQTFAFLYPSRKLQQKKVFQMQNDIMRVTFKRISPTTVSAPRQHARAN